MARNAIGWPGALLLCLGCFDLGDEGETTIKGQLTVGPGVAFAERGELYVGTFERAGVIDVDGRFEYTLPGDGPWGLHLYLKDYIYLPIQVTVREGVITYVRQDKIDWELLCETAGMCDWVDEPPDPNLLAPVEDLEPGNNPVLSNAVVRELAPGRYEASVEVHDPDGDLSHMILVHNLETGTGVQLNAPAAAIDGNFPDGVYRATLYMPEDLDANGLWQFVAADHGCSNSDIIEVRPQRGRGTS